MDSFEYEDYLEHYGIKGMKWGVRRPVGPDGLVGSGSGRPEGVSRRVNRDAKKDAKEFARAKMFYGEGAGNRRKLIKNKVEGKSKKDPTYKKAFDHHVENQDMSKHASKAKRERGRKDVAKTTAKTARGVKNLAMGTGASVTLGAAAVYAAYQNPQVRATVKQAASQTQKKARSYRNKASVKDYLKKNGFA